MERNTRAIKKIIPGPYTPNQKIWLQQQASLYVGEHVDESWMEVMIENLEEGIYETLEAAYADLADVLEDAADDAEFES